MISYSFEIESHIDDKIEAEMLEKGWLLPISIKEWKLYISTFPGVVEVTYQPANTTVIFDSPESKTWFILKYS